MPLYFEQSNFTPGCSRHIPVLRLLSHTVSKVTGEQLVVFDGPGGNRYLFIGEHYSAESLDNEKFCGNYVNLIASHAGKASSVLVVGGGTGLISKQISEAFPSKSVTDVEIDSDLIHVAMEFFPEWSPNPKRVTRLAIPFEELMLKPRFDVLIWELGAFSQTQTDRIRFLMNEGGTLIAEASHLGTKPDDSYLRHFPDGEFLEVPESYWRFFIWRKR